MTLFRLSEKNTRWLGALVLALTAAWFLCSRLAFTPVPWPDGSAFYLPTLDLFSWPPRWQAHAQSAFVPSYNEANFNNMPGLPLYFGIFTRLGLRQLLGSVFAIQALSLVPFLLWAWVIWRWLAREKVTAWLCAAVALSALWDPTVRWGTLVVRPEMWMGLFWALILVEVTDLALGQNVARKLLGKKLSSLDASLWRVSLWLALAAYCHFEAAYLVPATALALAGSAPVKLEDWWRKLLGVAWRTVALLSPWLLYVLVHFRLFFSQMEVQFHRLDQTNRYMGNAYLFFHSLFMWLGSPVGTPKFFNLAKAIFWALAMALTLRAFLLARRPAGFVRLGACLAWWTGLYLWWSKPEVWFTTMCHVTLWPWVALELVLQTRAPREPKWRTFPWAIGATAVLSFLATLGQMLQIPPYYTRTNYRAWVDCIEKQTELARVGRSGIPEGARGPVRIWQPHVPDVLIELSDRHGDYDLTRTLDFEARRSLALEFGRKAEVLLFTRFFNLARADERVTLGADSRAPVYDGPERPEDLRLLTQNEYESPFGPWASNELDPSEPGARVRSVCQVGPFWAEIFRKK